ncbi:MAG: THUMP domain-containing protein [Candidatus Methanofastidiosia archaeon]
MNCILIRYGEIGTKSNRTRRWWEKLFMGNIADALKTNNITYSLIENPRGRIIVYTSNERAIHVLKHVFGISSMSFAKEIELDLFRMKEEALALYREEKPGTFRISTQRLNKKYSLTSQEVNAAVGEYIVKAENAEVNLGYPDIDIGIEILFNAAYVFTGRMRGHGGIPVGVQGKVQVELFSKRAAVAAWTMLKRGCTLAVYGDKKFLKYLKPFSYGQPIEHVPHRKKAKQCLAEVFCELDIKKREIPSFYPLLGLDKQKIQEIEAAIFESDIE